MPIGLTYDTLPSLSTLRRQVNDDGSLTISSGGGECSELARRAVFRETGLLSGCVSGLGLAIAIRLANVNLAVKWGDVWWIKPLLYGAIIVGFLATFLLSWRLWYRKRQDDLE